MKTQRFHYHLVAFPIFLMIIVFILWASLMSIGEFVRGVGKVIPSQETQKVQHLEGGIVSDIYIREGQRVEKGDALFRVRNEFAVSNLAELEARLYSAHATEARLQAELSGSEFIQFSSELIEQIPEIVENERKLFQGKRNSYLETLNAAQSRLDIARLELQEKRARLKNLIIEREYAKNQRDITEQLSKSGAGSQVDYLRAVREYQRLVTEVDDLKNSIPSAERAISEASSTLNNVTNSYNISAQQEISQVLLEIKTLQENIRANQDRVSRTDVVAPVNGIIQKVYFNTIGGIVSPGDLMAEVIPVDEILVIDARIKPEDRSRVWNGQEVSISITAYDNAIYGSISGRVIEISADTRIEEAQGYEYYAIKIQSEDAGFGVDNPIYPGMVAEVNIITGKRTIMQYIMKPISRAFKGALSEP